MTSFSGCNEEEDEGRIKICHSDERLSPTFDNQARSSVQETPPGKDLIIRALRDGGRERGAQTPRSCLPLSALAASAQTNLGHSATNVALGDAALRDAAQRWTTCSKTQGFIIPEDRGTFALKSASRLITVILSVTEDRTLKLLISYPPPPQPGQ